MIPVNVPDIGDEAAELLADCAETGWVSSAGEYVTEFEDTFAEFVGVDHAVSCCNGTAALEMAVTALDIDDGDEVIMPSHTIISCAIAVVENGGVPVLVDVEPDSWQMDVDQVEAAITDRTAAIMPVHIFGHPTDMEPLVELAVEHDLAIVEDAAESHGAQYKGERVGSIGDLGVFSFYANKIVTTGEGGMVVTDDDALAERLHGARNLFFRPDQRFVHDELGFNYRMTNMQAAVGVAQMNRVDEFIDRKRWQRREYMDRLADVDGITPQTVQPWADHVNWVFGVTLDDDVPFDAFEWAERLEAAGVETRPFFWPLHEQPVFDEMGLFGGESYPVAERIARRGLYLPSGMALTEEQIDDVADAVIETLP
ncbi:DegT/DnrJ/EryC1/StrS family aminotransferase [Halobaculum sp. D14]|uniref:DegT/DnrJ/EryC1/StrS family aminotransferase n=1 Tax=unclassified Halobaculum TaxID=2640896 RepID=UPI003EBA1947